MTNDTAQPDPDLIPIYRFLAADTDPWRYCYSSNPSMGVGWTLNGVAFYAYQNEQPGTVPFFQYHAEDPWRYCYSSDLVMGKGWIKDAIAFHAYKSEKEGTIPIYQYHADDPWRYFYSSDPSHGDGWIFDCKAFYAVSGEIRWTHAFSDLTYDTDIQPATQQDIISTRRFRNTSKKTTLTQTVNLTGKKSASFEWGLTQNLSTGVELGFEAGVPFGTVSGGMNITLDLGAHQTWSETKEQEFTFTETVEIPPGAASVLEGIADWAENVVTPFTLTIHVSAIGDDNVALTGNEMEPIFRRLNPNAVVEGILEDYIIVSLRGRFIGAFAIDTFTCITPLALATA